MPRSPGLRALVQWAAVAAVLLAACASVPQAAPQTVSAGDPERGRAALVDYGCISCHRIPGVPGASALVGPPLDGFGQRSYIAGSLPNNQRNLVRWIRNPQQVEPGTAMPDLGVTSEDALDISAYLLSLVVPGVADPEAGRPPPPVQQELNEVEERGR